MTQTQKRSDIHCPSQINPADYTLTTGVGAFHYYRNEWSTCAHCGHSLRYAVRFEHTPTGEILDIGEDCAVLISQDNRIEYEMQKLRNRIAKERKEAKYEAEALERRIRFETDEPEIAEFLNDINPEFEKFGFLNDMVRAYNQYGSLTERQLDATKRIVAKRQEQAVKQIAEALELENAPDAPEGKVMVEGTILSIKWQESMYGQTQKMLVKLDDGNKVFGTVPNSLYVNQERTEDYVGTKIKFSANFERKETHFSYYSRPTKLEVVS